MRTSTKQTKAATAPAARKAPKVSSATKASKRKTDRPTTNDAAEATERSEELRFKVTESFKQQFKQAAKEIGLKKSALLEKLLADWRARQPAPADRALSERPKDISPAKLQRARDRR